MIEAIFTLDYEIYGDGTGTLRNQVYEPGARLRDVFVGRNARFVAFVEPLEFGKIEEWGTDPDIDLVKNQIREYGQAGFEIGLHLHPQWTNARYENGRWNLDYREYNLCRLPRERIEQVVAKSLHYLRTVLGRPDFIPLAFRAGNWLFQPTRTAAAVLSEYGMRIDSSVFKGGVQRNHRLDYRRALRNGDYWAFSDDANEHDPHGKWIEIPIHTEMVPFWRMLTSKRVGLQSKGGSSGFRGRQALNRGLDFCRLFYPSKLDFCRMTLPEMKSMMSRVLKEDRRNPGQYRPVVAIGHTKDLVDLEAVHHFLGFLKDEGITVGTFESAFSRVQEQRERLPISVVTSPSRV